MARPETYKKHKFRYKYAGRTGKFTEEVVKKLEEAAAIGASVAEMCFYAGISQKTYYSWLNEHPQLSDRINDLRESLPLQSRKNIAQRIHGQPAQGDVGLSQWLLTKVKPNEFGDKVKLEHSGEIGQGEQLSDGFEDLRKEFKERLKQRIREEWKKKSQQKNENNK